MVRLLGVGYLLCVRLLAFLPSACGAFASFFYVLSWMFRMVVAFGLRCVCLRFIFFDVVRLLAFLPLVCGSGTVFFIKKLFNPWAHFSILHFFSYDFDPLEAHFGVHFGAKEPFGRHLEFDSRKGQ